MATKYRYRLVKQKGGSDKYGNCEVCHKPPIIVYAQYEEREYLPGRWTSSKCRSLFGHKGCLLKKRR